MINLASNMKKLECIIFNVEHGLAVYIKSPNDYGIMIDCGGSSKFSPIKWINSNYNTTVGNRNKIKQFEGRNIAELFITHLHKDHFEDIGRFKDDGRPKGLLSDSKTLHFIRDKIKDSPDDPGISVLKEFVNFRESYNKPVNSGIDYGMNINYVQLDYDTAKDVSASDDKLINNRSFVCVIEFAGKKILLPGDIEVEGWSRLLENKNTKDLLNGINFFVASHHGHKSGFMKEILDTTGIPDLFVVSAKSGDSSIDTSYSKDEYVKGHLVKNDNISQEKKMISTREFGRSIKITIWENGSTEVEALETRDNVSIEQRNKITKRTERFLNDI